LLVCYRHCGRKRAGSAWGQHTTHARPRVPCGEWQLGADSEISRGRRCQHWAGSPCIPWAQDTQPHQPLRHTINLTARATGQQLCFGKVDTCMLRQHTILKLPGFRLARSTAQQPPVRRRTRRRTFASPPRAARLAQLPALEPTGAARWASDYPNRHAHQSQQRSMVAGAGLAAAAGLHQQQQQQQQLLAQVRAQRGAFRVCASATAQRVAGRLCAAPPSTTRASALSSCLSARVAARRPHAGAQLPRAPGRRHVGRVQHQPEAAHLGLARRLRDGLELQAAAARLPLRRPQGGSQDRRAVRGSVRV
jgi:hypothetical protein